jgi:phospholipid/cholesterol/gamma-HCH transport system substrate-binding protein
VARPGRRQLLVDRAARERDAGVRSAREVADLRTRGEAVIKQAPTRGRLAAMIVFALSCFGILLFLWTNFGGSIPLAAQGYRYKVDFAEATQLTTNADVRMSGVTIGRVTSIVPHGRTARATLEIDSKYAPIASDSRAILRAKTLLGETYVEITPGSRTAPKLPEDALLPAKQVLPTTELDEVLRALDPRTRADLQKLLGGLAHGLNGRGEDINAAVGNLAPFADNSTTALRILDAQHRATRRLVSDTGRVLDAMSARQGALASLVRAGDRVLQTTARRDAALTQSIRILPTTLAELRPTLDAVAALSRDAAPVVHALRPGGRAFAPALRDTSALAPQVRTLFADVERLAAAARTGLPAATATVKAAQPLFDILNPVLRQLVPVTQFLGHYNQDLITSFANLSAATQGSQDGLHYVRVVVPFTQEGYLGYSQRIASNRHNPYFAPQPLLKLKTGLESFDCQNANGTATEAAPPCKVQQPLEFQGRRTAYPHVEAEGP